MGPGFLAKTITKERGRDISYEGSTFLIGDFDESLEDDILGLTKEIQSQAIIKEGAGQIDLYINSHGGYFYLLRHVINLIEIAKRNGTIIRTIVPANAFSCGSLLAVAGTPGERYIARNAEHMVHYGSAMSSAERTPVQIRRMAEYKERSFKAVIDLYNKYCDIPGLDVEMLDDEFFITADKAIKYKMADKYMESLVI